MSDLNNRPINMNNSEADILKIINQIRLCEMIFHTESYKCQFRELNCLLNCLSEKQLIEFASSMSKCDRLSDQIERIKVIFGVDIENEEIKAELEYQHEKIEKLQLKIRNLYESLYQSLRR